MQESRSAAPLLSPFLVVLIAVVGLGALALAVERRAAAAPPAVGVASAPNRPIDTPTYTRDIAPVLRRWCVRCHDARESENSLRLDSFEAIMRGGDAGPAVVAGDPEQSLLLAKVERRDRPAMPPRRRFPAQLTTLIRAWIAAGAPR